MVTVFSKISAVSSGKPDRNESAGNRITEINFTLQKLDKFDGQIISGSIASEIAQLIQFTANKFGHVILIW